MKGLESQWKQLRLPSEEDKYIIVDEIALEEGIRKGGNSIIRKLHVERPIDREVL